MQDTFEDARRACGGLVEAFCYHVDHREFEQAVSLFTETAVFERPELIARGCDQISAVWANRPASVVTRHLCGRPYFLELGVDVARAVTQVTLYHAHHEGEGLPVVKGPIGVVEFHDRFERTGNGWKIAQHTGLPVLLVHS